MSHTLVVRLDSDGDVLLTGPAVRAVAAASERVTMLCSSRGRGAAQLLPGVDDIVTYDAPWVILNPNPLQREEVNALVDDLAARSIDRAVIFTSFHQSSLPIALLLRMAGIRHVSAISIDYPGSLLDVRHNVSDDIHEVERSLSLIEAAGYERPSDVRLSVKRDETYVPPMADYVVVHPGAAVSARAWAPERHRMLVDLLADDGLNVIVTGGPSERELATYVAGSDRPNVLNLAGETTLAQLATLLHDASAVVVGNTGPAHLAAAAGAPVVSLFAATVPLVRWHPWAVPQVVLGDLSVPCRNCRARECPITGHPCLNNVQPAEVVAAVHNLLAAQRSSTEEVSA